MSSKLMRYMIWRAEVLSCFFIATLPACSNDPSKNYTNVGVRLTGPSCNIPKAGYNTYTFFIDTSGTLTGQVDIQELSTAFDAFTKSIGYHNLAIWCGSKKKLNTFAGKYYADKFGLTYNNGPYVVITDQNPEDAVFDSTRKVAVSLRNLSNNDIKFILNEADLGLRNSKNIEEIKLRLKRDYYIEVSKNLSNKALDCISSESARGKCLSDVAHEIILYLLGEFSN